VSREVIADPVAAVPRPRTAVEFDLCRPDGDPPATTVAVGPRRLTAIASVLAVLTALVGGAVAGDRHATDLARRQAAAATRVLVWSDGEQLPGDADGESGRHPTLRVSLAVTGGPVTVLRLLLGAGTAEATALQVRPGAPVDTELALRPDCAALTSTGADPRTLGAARALVRIDHLEGVREVPLDVLGDPAAVMLPLLAPCTAGGYGNDG
jgi:hypothetical protein